MRPVSLSGLSRSLLSYMVGFESTSSCTLPRLDRRVNSYGPISPLVIGYGLIMLAESAWVNIRCTSIIQASSDNYAGIIHLLHTTWYMINAK